MKKIIFTGDWETASSEFARLSDDERGCGQQMAAVMAFYGSWDVADPGLPPLEQARRRALVERRLRGPPDRL